MRIEAALARFLVQLEADGRSPHTVAQYRRHVVLLAAWASSEGLRGGVAALGPEELAAFLVSLEARTRADSGGAKRPGSVNALRASLRGFFGYLQRAGIVAEDATRLLRRATASRPRPKPMIPSDADALLAALEGAEGPAECRDRGLFMLMIRTGVRLGSALGLDVDDLDLVAGEARLRRVKGGDEQVVFVPAVVIEALAAVVEDAVTGPLFQGRAGGRLTARHAQRRLALWLERAGVARRYSPHSMRHSFATALYQRTGDLLLVKEALGHRAIGSTLVYAQVDRGRLREAVGAS
jgi:site-specific recombinase XerC